ncbi:MAG: DNA mismatch repair endonuclease MutL [Lachnospiraceae bacterium]|nr:DNA mismatch repair endonuclease MutL [Lachnospiraceae bacterium]
MPKIHVLDQETINQIAAGEVVERPMAVVKELVENAIDAEANAVTVEIKDGGKSLIRITDNGSGIAKEDIPLAFTPHATSKIGGVEDLLEVSSLGFRGEALASVAAVSQLEMVTKTREALMGSRYVIHGGEEKTLEAVGCPEGTTFIVRNLFYNTPARLKFLKTPPTEAGYIGTVLERLALSHPEVAFRYIAQNQTKLTTPGNGNLKDTIYPIYGRDIASNLIEIHREEVFCKVDGFLGKPVISRGNRNFMNYFINGRYIRSNVIHRAIEEAYAPYSMQHRYPFTVLHLTIEPAYIDVNVHPQKMEIRFTREKEIFQSIYHALSEALKQRELIPDVSLHSEVKKPVKQERGAEFFEKNRRETRKNNLGEKPIQPSSEIQLQSESLPKQQTQAAQLQDEQPALQHDTAVKNETKDIFKEQGVLSADVISTSGRLKEQAPPYGKVEGDGEIKTTSSMPSGKPVQQSLFEEELSGESLKELRIVGQVFSTYWVLQYEDSMYLVDQHAAHEKVLYERFMKQLQEKEPMTQMVQPPILLTLSMQEEQALSEHGELLETLGFQIEPFGGKEYAVSGVPAHLPAVETDSLLMEALAMLSQEHGGKTPEVLLDKVASMSCKAAVKGNQEINAMQAEELLRELMTLENPYHCPHGRPTMIRMTKRELEKKFKRIV